MIPRTRRGIATVITVGVSAAVVGFLRCDAPRDNPLDPENPRNPFGVIVGVVEEETTQRPLEDALVYWSGDGKTAFTDSLGRFVIDRVAPRTGELIVEKVGYFKNNATVEWNAGLRERVELSMTPAPEADFNVYAEAQYTYQYRSYATTVRAELALAGASDVDSVLLIAPKTNVRRSLGTFAGVETKYYAYSLEDLGVADEQELIGMKFSVVVKRGETEFVVAEDFVERVFHVRVDAISPASGETIFTLQPVFEWVSAADSLDFPFTYSIEIRTQVGSNTLVGEITKIHPDSTRAVYAYNELSPDNYFWYIYCVDEFKNRSRSPRIVFEVVDNPERP